MRDVLEQIKLWFIHLFDVHCSDCEIDKEKKKACPNCEYLKQQLEFERAEKRKLLDYVLAEEKVVVQGDIPAGFVEKKNEPEVIRGKHIPWPVKRQMLEEEDRAKKRGEVS